VALMALTPHLNTIGLSSDEKEELLVEFMESDSISWGNVIHDAVEAGVVSNSAAVAGRLVDAAVAVYVAEGFPILMARAMLNRRIEDAFRARGLL
jgi:hypothetical protein